MPDEPEVVGLLTLMILQHARRDARTGGDGMMILLEDQDRSLWHRDEVEEGLALAEQSAQRAEPGPYRLQAAIAAVHCRAANAHETDWTLIASLYDRLHDVEPTPVVALNRAIAVAMAGKPERGIALLDSDSLAEPLKEYYWYYTARAGLLRRAGRSTEALAAYAKARALATTRPEREFLERNIAQTQNTP
jgi:RNA polymerase sigma-70 factor (ECF subfamily)